MARIDTEARVRTNCFLGACLAGGAAGVMGVAYGDVSQGYFVSGVLGAFFVLLAGHGGGFAGMLVSGAWTWMRHKQVPDYATDGVMLFGAFGAFLGIVGGLVAGQWSELRLWASCGALGGGVLAGLSGGVADMVFWLLVVERLPAARGGKPPRRLLGSQRMDPGAVPPPAQGDDDTSS